MKLKHYLFPSEYNDYRPWIITPSALAVFCLIIWGLRFSVPAAITFAASGIDAYDLMKKINSERTQRFIPALITNQKLITAATAKGKDMIARSYFAHVDPDGNYVWPRIEATGYQPYLTLGENLAMDFNSADSVISAWMNSPTHRANIVNEKFEDQGLASTAGTFEPQRDTIVVVSLFGTLYKTKTVTQAPVTPAPTPRPSETGTAVPAKSSHKKTPTPKPSPTPEPTAPPLTIYKEVKIRTTSLSGHTMVNIDVVINGSPALATARLKSQSITLIPGTIAGQYLGSFTFDNTEDLSKVALTVEARDKNGTKVNQVFPIKIALPAPEVVTTTPVIPVSNEAGVIKTLRIIFGIFAGIYMAFLLVDAIIIHRGQIKRVGIHSNPHILVLFLIAAVSLFANWL